MDATRRCPYCDEEIRAEAVRCRHCRSRIAALDPAHWYRDLPERRLAGVAAAVAQACAIPVAAARLGFLALTLFHFAGPILYLALWLLVPFRPGDEPPFAQGAAALRRGADELREAFAPRRPSDRGGASGAARTGASSRDVPTTGVPC